MSSPVLFAICVALLPLLSAGDSCLSPSVKQKVYTTTDSTASIESVVLAEFSITCKNGLKDLSLYAEFEGKTAPASRIPGTNTYQASFSQDHKSLPSGTYTMRIFDEEGYSALRKVQRSGESTDGVKALYELPISHSGIWRGPVIQSECVAALVAVFVSYMAYSARSRLQQS